MLQNGNHGHKSNRGHNGDKTLDLEFFRSMVLNSGEKMSSFDTIRKKPNESPGKDQVAEETEQDSPPSNGVVFGIATTNSSTASSLSSLACSSVSDMTKIGMDELCDDLQAQTISKRIDKWHLVSALVSLFSCIYTREWARQSEERRVMLFHVLKLWEFRSTEFFPSLPFFLFFPPIFS